MIFALVAGLLLILVLATGGRYPNLNFKRGSMGHMHTRMQELKQVHQPDLLVLGSSHAYRSFDVRIFENAGLSCFNLGSSNQTHIQTEVLLHRYLQTIQPKKILYEVNPEMFMIDGVESSLDLISNDTIDALTLEMALNINHLKTYNTLIHAWFHHLIYPNEIYTEDPVKGDDSYIPGGYVTRKITHFQPVKQEEQIIIIQNKQLQAFESNINLIKKSGIPYLLVYAPTTKLKYQSYRGMNEFEDKIRTYGPYINCNETLNLDDSLHFWDAEHLNQNGVDIFNNSLLVGILSQP